MKFPSPSSSMVYNQQQQQQEVMVMGGAEEGGVVIGMDVEDADPVEILGADFDQRHPPSDPDFFNSFSDDFDDSDIS